MAENRGETTKLAAAQAIIVAITVFAGGASINGLVKLIFFPEKVQDPHNALICIGILVTGLLVLRFIRTSLRRSVVFYSLFLTAIVAVAHELGYRNDLLRGEHNDLSYALYVPHLGILLTALVAGKRAAFVTAAGGVAYMLFIGRLIGEWSKLGPPVSTALVLPFTAVVVEKLLDEVEREARRAHLAESSIDIITHDMGNPLTVLSASLEILGEQELPSEQRDTLIHAIRRNSQTLRNLLDEFRDISRLDMAVPMEKVNLQGIAHDVVELYARPMCAKRGLILQANLQPVEIVGAPSRLSRMARELLTNAMKYTPRDGLIEVTLHAADQAILQVSDNGWGIKAEELGHVFEQHWRGSNVSKESPGSRGLGLFICKSIVESHGGHIEVESQENEGSTFTVYLPLSETAKEPSSPEVKHDQTTATQSQPDNSQSISARHLSRGGV